MNKVLIDIPMPENCEDCLICSLVPEHARLDMREHGLQYRLYCKVTGACVSGKGRDKACPLHERKKGKWISADAIFHGVPFYCNKCGEKTCDTVMRKPRWNFCPNCGAKMEGAEQE